MVKVILKLAVAAIAVFMAFAALRLYYLVYPQLDSDPHHGNYNAYFSDMQNRQIKAAKAVGIKKPIASRDELDEKIAEYGLVKLSENSNVAYAPMGHSVKYLTPEAADVLKTVGKNFRDSLDSKGIGRCKIVVTSVLRTDEDVACLMRHNKVAVKNSAHRYATTFDISYVRFIPCGLSVGYDQARMKQVLAEVLRDMREAGMCYVRYESSQRCFHITSRK